MVKIRFRSNFDAKYHEYRRQLIPEILDEFTYLNLQRHQMFRQLIINFLKHCVQNICRCKYVKKQKNH